MEGIGSMLTLGDSWLSSQQSPVNVPYFLHPRTVRLDRRVLASSTKRSNSKVKEIFETPLDLKAIGRAFFSSNDIPRLYSSDGEFRE